MSRHTIPGLNPKHEVAVGWDAPMGTFFGLVSDPSLPVDHDDTVLWVGKGFNSIGTVDGLVDAMKAHATIPPDMIAKLADDRAREGDKSQEGRDRVERFTGIRPA